MERERPRTIQPHRDHQFVLERGFQIVVDVPAIAAVWVEKTNGKVEERHVVVSGDHEPWPRQTIEKAARLPELAAARPLGEVARHGDEIRRDRLDGLDERVDQSRVDAAEME